MSTRVEHLTLGEAEWLGERLRDEDVRECRLMGLDPKKAVVDGYKAGHSWAIYRDRDPGSDHLGELIGAFGYTKHGTVWALFAKGLDSRDKLSIFRKTPTWVKAMRNWADRPLGNVVPSDHTEVIRWLEGSGMFTVNRSDPIDIGGVPHYRFTTRRRRII